MKRLHIARPMCRTMRLCQINKGKSMLKKGQPVKFTRPMSTMRVVLLAVEQGHQYRHDILTETKLKQGQVNSALWNLTYIGAVIRETDGEGQSIYILPGLICRVAHCLMGVRSIFDVR